MTASAEDFERKVIAAIEAGRGDLIGGNWVRRLEHGRLLMRYDSNGPGPTPQAWKAFETAARRFVMKQKRRSCSHALLAEALVRLQPDLDPDDDPRILDWAEIFADDPQLVACCDRCHDKREPFLPPTEIYLAACPTCGTVDADPIQWRQVHLRPLGLVVADETGMRTKLREVEINAAMCLDCWPEEGDDE